MVKKRNYGIDLLRIVAMFMIVVLHIQGHGGYLYQIEKQSIIQTGAYFYIEVLCMCAVDIYALISGYVSNDTRIRFDKILSRWLQVIFYSFVITLLLKVFGVINIDIKELLSNLLPVANNIYWYFTAYLVVLFVSPFINRLIDDIENRDAKTILIVLILLFSFTSLFSDPFCLQGGYTALWLVILYTIGKIIKKIDLFRNIKTKYLIITIFASSIVMMLSYIVLGHGYLTSYTSPTVVIQAICYLIVFKRIKCDKKIILKLSSLTFGSYLFHSNPYILDLCIKDRFLFINDCNIVFGIVILIISAIVVLLVGMLVEELRIRLYKLLKIDSLCKNLDIKINKLIEKL